MRIIDEQKIEISCPNCSTKIKEELDWFKKNDSACPGCGFELMGDEQFKKALDTYEEEFLKHIGDITEMGS